MKTYVLRRFLQMIPLLFGISALTFILLQLAPGDFLNQMAENPAISPATIEAMRRNFGLDKPWYVQYAFYLQNILLHFDFGESFSRHQPVFRVIAEGLGNTKQAEQLRKESEVLASQAANKEEVRGMSDSDARVFRLKKIREAQARQLQRM